VYSFDTLDTTARAPVNPLTGTVYPAGDQRPYHDPGGFNGIIPDYEKIPSQANSIGFKIRYEFTHNPLPTDGEVHYKVLDNSITPVSVIQGRTILDPVKDPPLTDPMPFSINIELQGRQEKDPRAPASAPSYKTEIKPLIPLKTLTTWQDLITFVRGFDVARRIATSYQTPASNIYDVDTTIVGWLIYPYYQGKANALARVSSGGIPTVTDSTAGYSINYYPGTTAPLIPSEGEWVIDSYGEAYLALPENVRKEIEDEKLAL
jgi:hypothetical protein